MGVVSFSQGGLIVSKGMRNTTLYTQLLRTPQQSRTQFSLWAVMAAPLLIGSNMLHMNAFDVETYTNQEVISVDQDPLGIQGEIVP